MVVCQVEVEIAHREERGGMVGVGLVIPRQAPGAVGFRVDVERPDAPARVVELPQGHRSVLEREANVCGEIVASGECVGGAPFPIEGRLVPTLEVSYGGIHVQFEGIGDPDLGGHIFANGAECQSVVFGPRAIPTRTLRSWNGAIGTPESSYLGVE